MAGKETRVPDDAVEYLLFPLLPDEIKGNDLEEQLREYLRAVLTHISTWIIDIIWQNEGFSLKPVTATGTVPAHLAGETNFGDNVEDEWFIVYILFQLSKQFTGLVAKVRDSDEEFLLIEAANALPKWLNPETAENRVFIYNGNLHIIPVPKSPADVVLLPHSGTSIGDAVECIRSYPEQTCASQKIQIAIQNRIKKFPDMMVENIHHTHSYIPASIAAILDVQPQLVAPAIRAFYYRDPIDLQCCRTFKYFRPGTRVMHRTKMTRCLYAQLAHQSFQPDKRCGWVMPSTSNAKFKSHDIGMKLAHGFEILCNKCGDELGDMSDTSIPVNDVMWLKYVNALKGKNYFRGELEGSILYKQLLENAKRFYQDNIATTHREDNPGKVILQLLKSVVVDIEERRRAEPDLPPPDDDSWLDLTPESLDAMMKERGGDYGNEDDTGSGLDLSKVADSMKTFVANISDIDGAEFPGPGGNGDGDDDADIQFDGTGFISAMQKMFEFDDDKDDSDSSEMSEYDWDKDSDGDSKRKPSERGKIKRPPSLDKYMDIMDRELAKTDVGKSFEKQTNKTPSKNTEKESTKKKTPSRDINDEDDDFKPVDIDMNTVKNLLQSYGAQEGLPGPTSNILGSMGVTIPPNLDNIMEKIDSDNAGKADAAVPSTKPTPPPRPTVPPRKSNLQKAATPKPPPRARLDSKETDV